MAKWIMFGFSSCTDPTREDEFVRWYKEMRQPDMLKTTPVKTCKMYETIYSWSEEEPRYFTIYEFETDKIEETLAQLQDYTKKLDKEGRGTDLFNLMSAGVYREINSLTK